MYLPDWSEIGPREHFVQFYASDTHLMECVASFFHAGLQAGEAILLVGTPVHFQGVEQLLRSGGWDLAGLEAEDRYVRLDAADTLRRFMVDEWPHPDLFCEAIGDHVMRAQRGGRTVRAYGEMVALLWEKGHKAAAIRLEELWNELGEILAFSLYCAYPERLFNASSDEASLARVCCAHSRVLRPAAA